MAHLKCWEGGHVGSREMKETDRPQHDASQQRGERRNMMMATGKDRKKSAGRWIVRTGTTSGTGRRSLYFAPSRSRRARIGWCKASMEKGEILGTLANRRGEWQKSRSSFSLRVLLLFLLLVMCACASWRTCALMTTTTQASTAALCKCEGET